jgi:hypothetical protein
VSEIIEDGNLPMLPAPALMTPDLNQRPEAQFPLLYLDILSFTCSVLAASAAVSGDL